MQMRSKILLFILSITLVISCDENSNKSSENIEDAFAKIDKKNESLFTKAERKKKYQESITAAEKNRKSISNSDATYNGYGSLSEIRREKKSKPTSKVSSKNIKYKRSAPVTFSAYSTN